MSKYYNKAQSYLIQKQRVATYSESKKIKNLLCELVRRDPSCGLDVSEFWKLREQLRHLSRVLDDKMRQNFLLRIGDINPLKTLIK